MNNLLKDRIEEVNSDWLYMGFGVYEKAIGNITLLITPAILGPTPYTNYHWLIMQDKEQIMSGFGGNAFDSIKTVENIFKYMDKC